MAYLYNAWYVAATHDELPPGALLARTYLDRPVVLFRDEAGQPHALEDRCPHRFAPLSAGTLCDGGRSLRCGYHGLQFDGQGVCVHNPQGAIPRAAVVRTHPVREYAGLIWLWPGDAAQADDKLIPDYSAVTTAPADALFHGYLPTACHYELFNDNILDLSHVDFLHATTLGSGAISRTRPEVSEPSDRSVRIRWLSSGDIAPPAFDAHLRQQGQPTDQWTEVTWTAPSTMSLLVGATLHGESREAGVFAHALHLATPETVATTHYWYWSARNFATTPKDNAAIAELVAKVFRTEDKPMVESQQRRMAGAEFESLKPVLLPGDAGAVRVRRRLKALIEAELRR
jgi:phenylpropionate dioxygenase-like ring-hydroxylating dioxygenase large terminal subunit